MSIDYMRYSNDKVIVDHYKMTVGLSYDIGLSESLSLGFQISYLTGNLSQYEIDNGTTTETIKLERGSYESLNRFDFSVGLRFNK